MSHLLPIDLHRIGSSCDVPSLRRSGAGHPRASLDGKTAVVIASGGNVDAALFAQALSQQSDRVAAHSA